MLSGKAEIKSYMNELTSEEKDRRRVECDENDVWFDQLKQKAEQFYGAEGLSMAEVDQNYASTYEQMQQRMYDQHGVTQSEAPGDVKVEDASLVEPRHMAQYNGFLRQWKQYRMEGGHQTGPQYYWHHAKLKKSTWESPVLVWKAFSEAKVPDQKELMPVDWDPIPNTPFLRVKLKSGAFYFIHKPSLRLFTSDPFRKKEEREEEQHEEMAEREEDEKEDPPSEEDE